MTDELATTPEPTTETGALVRLALDKDLDIEKLERVIALKEREDARSHKAAFIRDMNGLRRALPRILKTREGQHGVKTDGTKKRGMFAPLDDITEVLNPFCEEFGFIYDFDREVLEGREDDYVVCIVTHIAGHEKKSHYPAPEGDRNRATNKNQAVSIGEAYARRHALCAAFGITTADPDVDGKGSEVPGQGLTDEQLLSQP